ncbi:MFS transporter [Microbacterium pumilum]|uniref:MFS transporter n=1 Tax=Microbacterium pumilum TaxID=344165 RepID=A0ABN2RWI6_9MICO
MSQSDEGSSEAALEESVLAEARAEARTPLSSTHAEDAAEADRAIDSAAAPAVVPAPKGSLWRDRNFLTMWSGQALSQFGAQITELALPVLAVLILNATEWQVGVLTAANVAAFLVVGLPAGAWIDRMRKRHVMIVADLVRAIALASLPVLAAFGALQMWQIYLVAVVMGVATVFFDVSNQSIIPSLVRSHQIAEANGKLQSTEQLAGIAGPAFGGWLIGVGAMFASLFVVIGPFWTMRELPDAHAPASVSTT